MPAKTQVVLVWHGNVVVGGFEVFREVFFFLQPSRERVTVYFSRIYTNIRAVLQRSAEANELECGAQFLGVDGDGLCRGHRAYPSSRRGSMSARLLFTVTLVGIDFVRVEWFD